MGGKAAPVQILEKARKLLTDPNRWIQKALAKTIDGYVTEPHHAQAVSFCMVGALSKVSVANSERSYMLAKDALSKIVGPSIVCFNDKATHAEVLEAFDLAIKELKNGSKPKA